MVRYWYKVCPRCHQDALYVMKRADTGRLYLHCEECEEAWNHPEDVSRPGKSFLGLDIDGSYASVEEIEESGWSGFGLKAAHS